MPATDERSDAELVVACLGGDRAAFAQIVERYQRLLCSLAYSATGRLSESEDVAQEAFLAAWTDLAKLKEPAKLRPWLCGILRHKVGRLHRRDGRSPLGRSDSIEEAEHIASDDEPSATQVMNREEQALLWHSLEQLPSNYREPLVLYYREHRSIEHVAHALDLSESAVKQRLSRGRKLLQERMLAFVEGALTKSAPGPAFTAGVVAALATLAPPAKAAAVGTAGAVATKAGMTVKTVGIVAFLASISGLISTGLGIRTGLDQSRTKRERRMTIWVGVSLAGSCVLFAAGLYGLRVAAVSWEGARLGITVFSQVAVVGFSIGWTWLLVHMFRRSRALRAEERLREPEAFRAPEDQIGSKASEYRSRWSLFGIPLVLVRFAAPEEGTPPAIGWIAGGDYAIGILFAWGGVSVGFVSVGAFSVGVFSLGAVSVGVISLGTVAFGALALGAMAIGYQALGSLSAMGWESAAGGGFAVADGYAWGAISYAGHANDAAAQAYFSSPNTDLFLMAFFGAIIVLTLVPAALYARAVRRRLGRGR